MSDINNIHFYLAFFTYGLINNKYNVILLLMYENGYTSYYLDHVQTNMATRTIQHNHSYGVCFNRIYNSLVNKNRFRPEIFGLLSNNI